MRRRLVTLASAEKQKTASPMTTTGKRRDEGGDQGGEEEEGEDEVDHGGHRVLHQFVHPSQFRCLGYYPGVGDILVGTEEANILTFSLPKKLVEGGSGSGGEVEREEEEEEESKQFESKYEVEEKEVVMGEYNDDNVRSPRPGQLS